MKEEYRLIIEKISENPNSLISKKDLSKMLGKSERTIYRYINNINNEFDYLRLEQIKNKGILLIINDKEKFDFNFKKEPILESFDENIKKLLFYLCFKKISVSKIEEMIMYSQGSLNRLVSSVNDRFTEKGIYLVRKNNLYSLEGNEIQIRILSNNIWKGFDYSSVALPAEMGKEYARFSDFYIKSSLKDTDINVRTCLFISLLRFMNGKKISFNSILKNVYISKKVVEEKIKIIESYITKNYGVVLDEDERFFISLAIDSNENNNNYSYRIETITPIINDILKNIDKKYGTDYKNNDLLVNSISIHVCNNMTNYILMRKTNNDLLDQIRLGYTVEHVHALELASELMDTLNLKINDNDVGYFTLHFASCNVNDETKEKNVVNVIYCQSLAIAQLLASKIKSEYPSLNIKITKSSFFTKTNNLNEIIVTFEPECKINNAIVINPFVADDFKKIENKIIENQGYLPFVNLCKENNFYLLDCKTKKEFLNVSTSLLIKKGFMNEEESNRLMERENISSTEIAQYVAFPHFITHRSSFFAVFNLKQQILWHDNYVKLIIVMGYNKKDINNKIAIKYLFTNISQENKINKLVNSKTLEEFIEVIRKE